MILFLSFILGRNIEILDPPSFLIFGQVPEVEPGVPFDPECNLLTARRYERIDHGRSPQNCLTCK